MSLYKTVNITCPACGKASGFRVWNSINTALEKGIKEQVINREIFRFHCPHCDNSAYLNYDFLYHQMEDQIMIQLVTGNEKAVENAAETMRLMTLEVRDEAKSAASSLMKKYRHRIVTSFNSLIEKIFIFDAGLDDRLVELVKLIYLHNFNSSGERRADEIFFEHTPGGESGFVLFCEGKTVAEAKFDRGIYEDFEKQYSAKLDETTGDVLLFDRSWALSFLKAKK